MPTETDTLSKTDWRSAGAAHRRRNRFVTAHIRRSVVKRPRKLCQNRRSNVPAICISRRETKARLRLFRLDRLEFVFSRRFAEDDEGGRRARIRWTGSVEI